jgi:hypothetical protein
MSFPITDLAPSSNSGLCIFSNLNAIDFSPNLRKAVHECSAPSLNPAFPIAGVKIIAGTRQVITGSVDPFNGFRCIVASTPPLYRCNGEIKAMETERAKLDR